MSTNLSYLTDLSNLTDAFNLDLVAAQDKATSSSKVELYNGDCLEVMPLIPDASVDMILCDLPYGVTRCEWDSVIDLEKMWNEYKRICSGTIVLTATQPFTSKLVMSNVEMFKYEWIWHKNCPTGFLNCHKRPLNDYESILVFSEKTPAYYPQMVEGKLHQRGSSSGATPIYGKFLKGGKTKSNLYFPRLVLDIPTERKRHGHSTQKPVALMEYLLRTYTTEGQTVLDNCMGSGSTGVACVNLNRNFIGIEKDKKYFDIASERLSK